MLGEAIALICQYKEDLADLREERLLFHLANEDSMNEWAFEKKLAAYDERIAQLERALEEEEAWYEDLVENDSDTLREMERLEMARQEYERQQWFEELCRIDGVD